MSNITLSPYLFFTGKCREAMEFYKSVFGGELELNMREDAPEMVFHAHLTGGVAEILGSDGTRKEPYETCFITLAFGGSDAEKLTEIFNLLAAGGKVEHELKKQFWGATFGMVTDKFGVDWMVNITED